MSYETAQIKKPLFDLIREIAAEENRDELEVLNEYLYASLIPVLASKYVTAFDSIQDEEFKEEAAEVVAKISQLKSILGELIERYKNADKFLIETIGSLDSLIPAVNQIKDKLWEL